MQTEEEWVDRRDDGDDDDRDGDGEDDRDDDGRDDDGVQVLTPRVVTDLKWDLQIRGLKWAIEIRV